MADGGFLICDEIIAKKERTLEVKVKNMTFHVEISPEKIVVPNTGTYNGHEYNLSIKSDHMCGLQGYNPMLGDTCPACEEYEQNSRIIDIIVSKLRRMHILKKYCHIPNFF